MKRVLFGALGVLALVACGREAGITSPERDARVPSGWAAVGTDSTTGASIETNKDDYSPGEVVHVVGRGWAPNETVNLHMTEVPDTHADVDTNVVADAAGGFSIHFYDVQTHDVGVTFTLTATGQTSHSVAVAVFTDGNVSVKSSPAGVPSFTNGSYVKYNGNSTCGAIGTTSPGTFSVNSSSFTVVVGINASQSLKLTVPATLPGYTFSSWTVGSPATVASGSTSNPADLCIAIPANNDQPELIANYVASNAAPTVTLQNTPYSGNEGALINVSGTASDDGTVASTLWTVTGVPAGVTCGFAVPGNPNTTVTCNDNFSGTVTVTLTATDNLGATGSASTTLAVSNVAPTATFNAPGSVNLGPPFTISLTVPVDPSTVDFAAAFTYAFDCGSGTYGAFSSTNSTSCPTSVPGTFAVRGKIKDKDGGETEYSANVDVSNQKPTADAGGPYTVDEGSPVTITGTGTDPDGGAVTYLWSASPAGCSFADANASSTTVTCADNGSFTLTLKVTDNENEFTTDDAALTVNNVAPVVNAFNGATINEGGTYSGSGTFTDPGADTWSATVDYGDGTGSQPLTLGPGKTFSLSHVYTDDTGGPFTVTVTVTDDDGDSGSNTATVTVHNVAPVVSVGAATATVNEGALFSRAGSFTDPGADTWTGTVNYGDGGGNQSLTLNPDKTFNLSHTYTDDDGGPFTITVTVSDDDGGSDSKTITVTVNNVTPVVNAFAGATIDEGDTFTSSGSFTDPGADTWTATVDYGDGTGSQVLTLGPGNTFNLSHVYTDDDGGPFTVTVTVNDDDGGSGSNTASLTVKNVAPAITLPFTVPALPVSASTPVTISWNFTDPGSDTWTCTIQWDTGLPTEAATYVNPKSCSATKTLGAGIYTIAITVTDDDGGSDTKTATQYIVIYDPNAGFVTGGGWIDSPPGAYPSSPLLTGKANFGFVSKYQKGKTTPSGNTEFQFHAGSLNFSSTLYEWLVVAGPLAQYKGEGTVNGVGGYAFILSATDGQVAGGGGVDKFRIKIWNKTTGAVVYDNQIGALDDAAPTTAIQQGSIVIHSK